MKPITLRGMSRELERALRRTAAEMDGSLNRAAIALLERGAGLAAKKPLRVRHHDLDRFSGIWTAEEADAFDRELADQRRVEPHIWK